MKILTATAFLFVQMRAALSGRQTCVSSMVETNQVVKMGKI